MRKNNKKRYIVTLGLLCFLFIVSAEAKTIVIPITTSTIDQTANFNNNAWKAVAIFTEFTASNGAAATVKTTLLSLFLVGIKAPQ